MSDEESEDDLESADDTENDSSDCELETVPIVASNSISEHVCVYSLRSIKH